MIEYQIVATDVSDHSGSRGLSPDRHKNSSKWLSRLQQLGVVAILVGILRWRSEMKSSRETKLLMYFVASLGIACSIQRVRSSKPRK